MALTFGLPPPRREGGVKDSRKTKASRPAIEDNRRCNCRTGVLGARRIWPAEPPQGLVHG